MEARSFSFTLKNNKKFFLINHRVLKQQDNIYLYNFFTRLLFQINFFMN